MFNNWGVCRFKGRPWNLVVYDLSKFSNSADPDHNDPGGAIYSSPARNVIKKPELVVALDIGSTYSGYAWQWREDFLNNRSNIEFNTNWGSGAVQLHKTPTCILLDKDLKINSFGHVAESRYCKYCDDENGDMNKIIGKWYFFKRFKFYLYNANFKTDIPAEDFLGQQLSLKVVMSKLIEALKRHFIKTLEEKKFKFVEDKTLWVVTVPAIWSEGAKKFMRTAAEESIKPKHLLLAQEPESAALYCLNLPSEQKRTMNNFGEKGDKFVVIDLGGGTVDILGIEVLDDGSVRELCPGDGDRVGGQDVNNAFFQSCKDVIQGDAWHKGANNVEDLFEMEMEFESQKVRIGSSNPDDEEIRLKIPQHMRDMLKQGTVTLNPNSPRNEYFRIDRGNFKYNSKLIREILFGEIVKLILKPIQKILHNKELQDLRSIILVGGFAESKIVIEKIKDLLSENYSDVKVVVPTSPFRAVLVGAVLYGHDPLIFLSRISRATYGVATNSIFDPDKHEVGKRWKNEENGKEYCKDVFSIHVRKGQSVKLKDRQPCVCYYPMYKNQTQLGIPIFSSKEQKPKYTTDDGCQQIGKITVDIADTEKGTDRNVKVEMIYGGTELGVIVTDEQTEKELSFKYNLMD